MFNANDMNMTDGKTVFLSSNIVENQDFDPAVGLALHEGSHILLTDFRLFQDIWQNIPRSLYNIAEPKGYSKVDVVSFVQRTFNYVEDRFIDQYVYTSAPGYRGYYKALYDKYFYSDSISTMLESAMYRRPILDAYEARLINLSNKSTDLDALPGLRDIATVLDLSNIQRLTTTRDRLDVAIKIAEIVYENVSPSEMSYEQMLKADENGESTSSEEPGNASASGKNPSDQKSESDQDQKNGEDNDADSVLGGGFTSVSKPTAETSEQLNEDKEKIVDNNSGLSKSKRLSICKAISKQKVFIDGQISKKKVSKKEKETLDQIEKAGVSIVDVGRRLTDSSPLTKGVECIFVKNTTKDIVLSDVFPCKRHTKSEPLSHNLNAVNTGVRLGVILGRRLRVRNEINLTKYMRKSAGKIDRRVLAELGADNENVFYRLDVDKFKTAKLHISLDASSSMDGEKWAKSITTVTAICKAASMVNNLKVTVSIRATSESNSRSLPFVAIVYDSSKDSFIKVRTLFPYLNPYGSTPEGLCYEAIMDHLGESSSDEDCYFLNFSDGQPAYGYSSDGHVLQYDYVSGGQHTLRQVNMIRNKGYKVLSYYISDPNYRNYMINSNEERCFKLMYGTDASFIDVSNIVGVANTMNQMFLSKT
jgi:hypothetical protein